MKPAASSFVLPIALLLALAALVHADEQPPAASTESTEKATEKPAAEEPGKGEKQARIWFDMLDTNHDGRLEWSEVRFVPWKPLRQEFHTADTNGDGFLTPDEIRVLAKHRVAERRARKEREAREKAQAEQNRPKWVMPQSG